MELMKFEYNKGTTYCPNCNEDANCTECGAKMDYCCHCGEPIEKHDCFIVFTTDKYHGWNRISNYTATLIIDGKDYASAHVETDESDAGTDVIHMQLFYIPEEKQTGAFASIISAFAKWLRFDWKNPDMQSQYGLPSLVRLLGFTIDKRYGHPWCVEKWITLQNAMDIKPEHLAWEFTSKEIV